MGRRNLTRTGDLIFELNTDAIRRLAADCSDEPQPYQERIIRRAARSAWNNALTPRQKRVMDCYYRRNMNLKEIAVQESVTPSAVCRLLARARRRLKGILQYYLIQ